MYVQVNLKIVLPRAKLNIFRFAALHSLHVRFISRNSFDIKITTAP